MSATYNWAYRPGVTNKYGFTVPAGADSARPTGWCYVALFGNDTTGNGSRQYPFRTITKAVSLNITLTVVLSSGVYREVSSIITSQSITLIGDGEVVVDISYNQFLFSTGMSASSIYNLEIRGNGTSKISNGYFISHPKCIDVLFNGSFTSNSTTDTNFTNCIIRNYSDILPLGDYSGDTAGGTVLNTTFVNCNNINCNSTSLQLTSCIFYNCNISASNNLAFQNARYSLFFQTNFKLSIGNGNGGILYPSVPSGYTYYSTISALTTAYMGLYSASSFTGCIITDPLFNNPSIGDYSLSFSSPAKNLSFFGTYVGAKSIGYQIKVSATESTGNFDFSTNVNLAVANNSITLVDPTQNGSIKTNMIINSAGRQIQRFPIYGFNADRNGQYIDSIPDLDTIVKNAGDALTLTASYLVETGAITYNSVLYQPGDRLTTATGQTTFTTSTSGTLREILEAPERHTIMARFSDGGASVSEGDSLVAGNWYYIVSGTITYDSIIYNAGSSFKAVDTTAFSGSGTVIVALSGETFQHYEPGIQPTSNNTDDTRTGAIIRGNGDPAYVRGGYGIQEFPINAKFIQLYYIINVANLKP